MCKGGNDAQCEFEVPNLNVSFEAFCSECGADLSVSIEDGENLNIHVDPCEDCLSNKKEEGIDEGREEGRIEGHDEGYSDGYNLGKSEGYEGGCEDGQNQ